MTELLSTTTRNSRRTLSALTIAAVFAITACGGSGDGSPNANGDSGDVESPTGPTIPADATTITGFSATAMGAVESVEFDLQRNGAPVYIDSFESIALDRATGQFTVPRSAQALLGVEVNGSLNTELGAIALDDEVWLSNPITGDFETLPPGYDIDPSLFFDPENGWKPLMSNLTDITLVGNETIDGRDTYHVAATAPADQITTITARLVRNQDVPVDFWIDAVTGLVRRAEFTTTVADGDVEWTLDLTRYGDEFNISPPENVTDDS